MKKLILTSLLLIICTLNTSTVFATTNLIAVIPTIPQPSTLPGPTEEMQIKNNTDGTTQSSSISILIATVHKYAIFLIGGIGSVSFLFLIISGIRFLTIFENDESIKKAKDQAMYALIGFAIALFSYTIVAIISSLDFTS
jgi:hypothetical protein